MRPWIIVISLMVLIVSNSITGVTAWRARGYHEAAVALATKLEWDKKLEQERQRGDGIATALELEKRNIKTVTVEVIKEIPTVTTTYIEVPGEPEKIIPPAIYTYGFVRLWNNALLPANMPGSTGKPADQAARPGAARAPIDSPDILANAAENFSRYAECRAQLNALIDFEVGRVR